MPIYAHNPVKTKSKVQGLGQHGQMKACFFDEPLKALHLLALFNEEALRKSLTCFTCRTKASCDDHHALKQSKKKAPQAEPLFLVG